LVLPDPELRERQIEEEENLALYHNTGLSHLEEARAQHVTGKNPRSDAEMSASRPIVARESIHELNAHLANQALDLQEETRRNGLQPDEDDIRDLLTSLIGSANQSGHDPNLHQNLLVLKDRVERQYQSRSRRQHVEVGSEDARAALEAALRASPYEVRNQEEGMARIREKDRLSRTS